MTKAEKILTVAIPTGRLTAQCLQLVPGIGQAVLKKTGRKLMWQNEELRIITVKPLDIPVYVERGVADCGLVGNDILLETAFEVYELLDCGVGKCRLSIARLATEVDQPLKSIASKYQNLARDYCLRNGLNIPVIHLHGSVELAPALGLATAILDIIATGETLRANKLVEVEKIADVSVRLIANKAVYQLQRDKIISLIETIKIRTESKDD